MENLVRNPSFEEGVTTPAYWQPDLYQPAGSIDADFIWDMADFYSGSRSGKVTVRTIPGGSAAWIQYMDKATMLPGASYRLSAFYKSNGEGSLFIAFLDANGGYITGFFKYYGAPPALNWTAGILEFTTPTGADWNRVAYIFVGMDLAIVGFLSVDDYELYPTVPPPPPATYDLTIQVTAGGTTDPPPGTYTYDAGTVVTVTAYPDSGQYFQQWTLNGEVHRENPVKVAVNQNYTLTAAFAETPPPPPPFDWAPIAIAGGIITIIVIAIAASYWLTRKS